jgi:hypothetical protein
VQVAILGKRMSLVGYDNKIVPSRLTPWDDSTASALRFLARENQRMEVGRGERLLFKVTGCFWSATRIRQCNLG